jgi:hypothetical protein
MNWSTVMSGEDDGHLALDADRSARAEFVDKTGDVRGIEDAISSEVAARRFHR